MAWVTKDNVLDEAIKRKKELESIVGILDEKIKSYPDGSIRIANKGTYSQIYHITKKGDSNGVYLPLDKHHIARDIAQKDYSKKILKELKKEIASLDSFIKTYTPSEVERIYNRMPNVRKEIVTPVYENDEDYVKAWNNVEYIHKGFDNESLEIYTQRDERVRSKSEADIASCLLKYNVPYRYEYPIYLRGMGTVHADFLCLNVRTRKEYVWEHLGKLDDEDYSNKNTNRLNRYEENGFFPGKNLILTFETKRNPLNHKTIENNIREYLL